MSAGTITLTYNSATVTGAGTAFTTDLKAGDFIVSVVGGVTYTLPVKTVNSATGVTLLKNYDGPTQTGAAWSAVPRDTMNAITAQLAAETAQALRGLNYDKQNWQQVFSGTGTITVKLPDGSDFTGPSWKKLSDDLASKANSSDLATLNNQVVKITGNQSISGEKNFTGTAKVTADYPQITLWSTRSSTPNGTYGRVVTFGSEGNKSFFAARAWEGGNNTYVQYLPPFKDGYFTLWSTSNTTTDSSGFIKAASPIVKLYSDGNIETNSESEGVISERESVGVYRISGVLGMNSDGAWGGIDGGFEVPTDRNGQRLVWLDYEVEADGSILVKTYHRTYPDAPAFARNIKDGYEEGAPIDIPSDQFISVRVEMPQDSIWNLAQKAAQEAMEQEEIAEE